MSVLERMVACDALDGSRGLARQFRSVTEETRRVICQMCDDCGRAQVPPMLSCAGCNSGALSWVDVGDEGMVQSWVTVHTVNTTLGYTVPERLFGLVPYTTIFIQPAMISESVRIPAFMHGAWPESVKPGARAAMQIDEVGGRLVPVVSLLP